MVFRSGSQKDGEAFYKPLLDLGPVNVLAAEMPYHKANDIVPKFEERVRRLQGGANFVMPLDVDFVQGVADEFVAFVDGRGIGDGSMCMFECVPWDKVISVARDATAYPSRGQFYHFATVFMWQDEKLDGEIRQFQRKLLGKVRERGYQGLGGQYANYIGEFCSTNNNAVDPAAVDVTDFFARRKHGSQVGVWRQFGQIAGAEEEI
jgi:hypothetical protein